MIVYDHVTTHGVTQPRWLSRIADLDIVETEGRSLLIAVNQMGGGISSHAIAGPDQPLQMLHTRGYDGLTYQGSPRLTTLTPGDRTVMHVHQMGGAADRGVSLRLDTGNVSRFDPLFPVGPGADLSALGQVEIGATRILYSARDGDLTLTTHRMAADGSLAVAGRATLPVPPGSTDAALDRLAHATVDGQHILVAASGNGNFLSTHLMQANGSLRPGTVHVAGRGTGYDIPAQLDTVRMGDRTFVIMGAAASNSLTVFRLGSDGKLTTVDHVIDEGATRFQSVTALETVTLDGRVFVFVGGADDGISVFTLLPDGRLLHLTTIADTAAMTLADVSALRGQAVDGRIQLFVGSATETGITQFVFDPGRIGVNLMAGASLLRGGAWGDILVAGAGTTRIEGGAGNDILVAGPRPITLVGGTGADIFVPSRVKGRISIIDYDPAVDRLDMSMLGSIRSIWQLRFVPTSTGMTIIYGETILEITSVYGRGLTVAQFTNIMFPVAHYLPPEIDPVTTPPPPATRPVWLFGTAGPDRLTGTALPEEIAAGAGDDIVSGAGGNDTIRGEAGHDLIRGGDGDGDDRILGGPGRDTLFGDAGHDLVRGDEDDDLIYGGEGNDTLEGGPGHDRLSGGAGNDTLSGEDGNDILEALEGTNVLLGGAGNDTLVAGPGADLLDGGEGDDSLSGGAGNDRMLGGTGNDSLSGEDGNDWLDGDSGDDLLDGGAGKDTLLGGAGRDTLQGGSGDDLLYGQHDDDVLSGEDGHDTLHGGAGNDRLMGGRGNDRLLGNSGNDMILGGDGHDTALGGVGHDTIYGDAGNDVLYGQLGFDLLFGGLGDDRIYGGMGNDQLHGDAGDDTLMGGAGRDHLFGGDGDDRLDGGAGNDMLDGGLGNDTLLGGLGHDSMFGGDGNDLMISYRGHNMMRGGAGNDTMRAGSGNDRMSGEAGHDRMSGGTGNDRMFGGAGNDLLVGGAGNDLLRGDAGNDTLNGGAGHDRLLGGAGNDRLLGGPGQDTLVGGAGRDVMQGGAGEDVFRYLAALDSRPAQADLITDFRPGEDLLDLRPLKLTYLDQDGHSGARSLRWEHVGAQTHVFADVTGDGQADLMIRLAGRLGLDGDDFLL
ncbi:calcium-binding protein [Paracoccus liaowanqingii]|nr:calcium-binding protein [Paracoccus liaowanqingii]